MKRRRVTEISDEEDNGDPIEEPWFAQAEEPSAGQSPTPAEHRNSSHQIHVEPTGMQMYHEAMQYTGDLTDDQLFANVDNIPTGPKKLVSTLNSIRTDELCLQSGMQSQNDYLRQWRVRRSAHLRTILASNAPADSAPTCQSCRTSAGTWRCQECFGGRILCSACLRRDHRYLIFHRIECWNGKYFHPGALWQVGVKLYLGHGGESCQWTVVPDSEGV